MINFSAVNNMYYAGLAALMVFPFAYLWLDRKGFFKDRDNERSFFMSVFATSVFVGTMMFIMQEYGLNEKVQERYGREVAKIEAEYNKLLDENKTLEANKREMLEFEKEVYKKIVLEALKEVLKKRR